MTIGGGHNNSANGSWGTVPGGRENTANGQYSFAAGRRAKALHDGAWVWADSQDVDFASTAIDHKVEEQRAELRQKETEMTDLKRRLERLEQSVRNPAQSR